jgi:type IV pilus assembly protein PilV
MMKPLGFTLLEVLVALAILAVGLLGIAGLMIKGQKASYEAYQRQQAVALAQDMLERVRANPAAAANYVTGATDSSAMPGWGNLVSPVDCLAIACSPQQLALHDLVVWDQQLSGSSESFGANRMGGIIRARGCIESIAGTPNSFMVSVSWQGGGPTAAPSSEVCKNAAGSDVPPSSCGKNLYAYRNAQGVVAVNDAVRRMVSLCLSTPQSGP